MPTYKTPGVYVEEISTLPPSVAEVSTANPAFIGHTEKGPAIDRISTLLEFRERFGGASPTAFSVTTAPDPATGLDTVVSVAPEGAGPHPAYLLYYAVSAYFQNGGGPCWIVSVGSYKDGVTRTRFEAGLDLLEREDEPTLILLTDSVRLASADYYAVCQKALAQCAKLGDRFAILDVLDGAGKVAEFRQNIGTSNLKYGAAYTPYLQTVMNFHYLTSGVTVKGGGGDAGFALTQGGIVVGYQGAGTPTVKIVAGQGGEALTFLVDGAKLTITNVSGKAGSDVVAAFAAATGTGGFSVKPAGDPSAAVPHTSNAFVEIPAQAPQGGASRALATLESSQTALYQQVLRAMALQRVVLPPSGAVAGVYATTDRERGVWKAPANVSLAATIGPVGKITHEAQEDLNVDPTAGKSINAIREFTGKGTLVWGARTLAGNDNEWRYVPVRRLFNMIEESSRKATSFAVFEPNDATTWLKVKGMLESFLYGLWERGALAGPTSDAAYFVNVGLGKTMTPQDVLEGRMIVEIGVAAVRPAEFIILRFMHKLQQA